MEKNTTKLYPNAFTSKIGNRKVSFVETDNGAIMIQFLNLDKENDINKPACTHKVLKGKVRETIIKLTPDIMERLALDYINWRKYKAKLELNKNKVNKDKL